MLLIVEDDDDDVDDEEEDDTQTLLVAEDLVAEDVGEDDNTCLPSSFQKGSCCRVSRDG